MGEGDRMICEKNVMGMGLDGRWDGSSNEMEGGMKRGKGRELHMGLEVG